MILNYLQLREFYSFSSALHCVAKVDSVHLLCRVHEYCLSWQVIIGQIRHVSIFSLARFNRSSKLSELVLTVDDWMTR